MITIKRYVRAESLDQAYELNRSRSNRIIGGMLWMKMGNKNIQTAIDLQDILSNEIKETPDAFSIGAMTSLHDMEIHEGLNKYTNGAVRESLRHIVGVQFRNGATVGGSVYGRFGFSDVLTMLMALDTQVVLYKRGVISLEKFVQLPYDNDILMSIVIKKVPIRTAYSSVRNSKTDFPVLTCAVSFLKGEQRVVIGARPQKAVVVRGDENTASAEGEKLAGLLADKAAGEVRVGSNMRASAEFRSHLVKVLTKRTCLAAIEKGDSHSC